MQYYEDQLGPTNQKALLWFLLRAIKSTWWEHSWKISYKNLSDPTQYVKGPLRATADSAPNTLSWTCRWRNIYSTARIQSWKCLLPLPSPLSMGFFHLSLTSCYNCCGSLRGRLMGSSEQPCWQLPCCLLKPYKAELPTGKQGILAGAASFTLRTLWQGPGNCTLSFFMFWNRRLKRGKRY